MHADAALVPAIRARAVPDSALKETANLLVMPTSNAANISFNLLKAAADGLQVGPILLGMKKPLHVLVPSVTARGIVNLTRSRCWKRGDRPSRSGRGAGGRRRRVSITVGH